MKFDRILAYAWCFVAITVALFTEGDNYSHASYLMALAAFFMAASNSTR